MLVKKQISKLTDYLFGSTSINIISGHCEIDITFTLKNIKNSYQT